jgi:hypothetical protein
VLPAAAIVIPATGLCPCLLCIPLFFLVPRSELVRWVKSACFSRCRHLSFAFPIAVFPVSPVRFLLQVLLPCHPSASLALVPRSTQYAGVQVLAVHDFLLLLHRVLSVVGAFAASFGVSVRCHLLVLLVDFCSLVGSTGPTCIVLFPFSHSCISRNVCKAVKGLVNLCLSVDYCKWILGLVLEPPDQRFKFF